MFHVQCVKCGSNENGAVTVSKSPKSSEFARSERTLSQNLKTRFECDNCSTSTTVSTGIHPTSHTEKFETVREQSEDSLKLEIDGSRIEFESIDEKISKDARYTPDGVRGTSHIQHVHICVVNPPSLSKGKHQVTVGEFVDEEMTLGTVRYHTSTRRTLKFYKRLDSREEEPLLRTKSKVESISTQK